MGQTVSVTLTSGDQTGGNSPAIVATVDVPAAITITPPAPATGTIALSGGSAGADVPLGTIFTQGASSYATTADEQLDGTGASVIAITCTVAGAAGNAAADTTLTIASVLPGVPSTGVSSALAGGVDQSTAYGATPAISVVQYKGGLYVQQPDGTFLSQAYCVA